MWHWLWANALLMMRNPEFSGIVVATIIGGAVYALKEVPLTIAKEVRDFLFTTTEIYNDNVGFEWFEKWLGETHYAKSWWCRVLRMTIAPTESVEHDDYEKLLAPGVGLHLFFYKGWFVWVTRHLVETNGPNLFTNKRQEHFSVHIFFGTQRIYQAIMDEAQALAREVKGRVPLYVWNDMWWQKAPPLRPRAKDTIALPEGKLDELFDDAAQFAGSLQRYVENGIPYRRGYLLKGVPGSGKTSVAIALASYLRRPLYVIMLSGCSDMSVSAAMMSVPKNAIVLLEDVDTVRESGDRQKRKTVVVTKEDAENRLTLGGLLNAIDGVFSSEGRILIMTTNDPEVLDEALVRPGRVDYELEFGFCDPWMLATMFSRYFRKPFLPSQFEGLGPFTPATVQGALMGCVVSSKAADDLIQHMRARIDEQRAA